MPAKETIRLLKNGSMIAVESPSDAVRRILETTLFYNRKVREQGRPNSYGRKQTVYRDIPIDCCKYVVDPDGIYPPRIFAGTGYIKRVTDALAASGYPTIVENLRPHKKPEIFVPQWDRLKNVEWRHRQKEAIELLTVNEYGVVKFPTGYGKLISDDTLVPTPKGFVTHGSLQPGDFVYHPSGKAIKVVAVSSPGVASLRVRFSDGGAIDVHPNHEWFVYARGGENSRGYRVLETKQLAARKLTSPNGRKQNGNRCTFQVDYAAPLAGTQTELLVSPYVLAVWLGDGSSAQPAITHGRAKDEVVEQCAKEGFTASSVCMHKTTGVKTSYIGGDLKQKLRQIGVLNNKHIPPQYLQASVSQRRDLLDGLIDTDGHVSTTGKVCFVNTKERLIRDVVTLVRSLGYRANVSSQQPALSSSGIHGKQVVWTVAWNPHDGQSHGRRKRNRSRISAYRIKPQRKRRGIVAIEPLPEPKTGKCIQVDSPDGLYLVTEQLITTHNSFLIRCLCQLLPQARIAITTPSVDVIKDIYDELTLHLPLVGIKTSKITRAGRRITCYSSKSLHYCEKDVDILICDEFHELGTDKSFQLLAAKPFRHARRWGLSANYFQLTDKVDFELEAFFGPLVAEITYDEAVDNDCIVPIEVHWRDVVMNDDPGAWCDDPVSRERHSIWRNVFRNKLIAEDACSFGADEQVLITVKTIDHGLRLRKLLPEFQFVYSENAFLTIVALVALR